MDVDIATLLPITCEERTFLLTNKGCLRCRKVNADHKQADCMTFVDASKRNGNKEEVITPRIEREKGDWMLNPTISEKIFATWGQPKIDLFASNANKQAAY
jgi:hypothetical protein